jgi:hypothetical protein
VLTVAHFISGFIGRLDGLREAATALEGERVVPLFGGFGFLPLAEQPEGACDVGAYPELSGLTTQLATWAAEQSRRVALAYIETEYWAGSGIQVAIVWENGAVALGPLNTSREDAAPSPPSATWAINQAARALGVTRGEKSDEFDTLGLGKYRSNNDWLTAL